MYNSGYKSPEKNKVNGPRSLKLGHPVLSLSLSIFLHSLTSSIQRISLDSAEAGPQHCSMSSFNCCFLTCIQISQEAGQVVWYSHLLKNFPQFIVIHTVKGFGTVNKAEPGKPSNSQEPPSKASEEDGTLWVAESPRVKVPQSAPRGILTRQGSLTFTCLSSPGSRDP